MSKQLSAAIKLFRILYPDWKLKYDWPFEGTSLATLHKVATTDWEIKISESYFYAAIRDPEHQKSQRLLIKLDALHNKEGYHYDERKEKYIKTPSNTEDFYEPIKAEDLSRFFQEALMEKNPTAKLLTTYMGNCLELEPCIEKMIVEGMDLTILLAHPDGEWARYRNQYPHPKHMIDISSQVKSELKILYSISESHEFTPNLKVGLYHGMTPECMYIFNQDYYYSGFSARQFAIHSKFHHSRYPEPKAIEREKDFAFLLAKSEMVIPNPNPEYLNNFFDRKVVQ
ncbi:MAG: hypothetical protein AAFR61_29215 [Bacteroidota bacterium]